MSYRPRHRWDLTPKAALALQQRLASRVTESPLLKPPRYVGGADCAFADNGKTIIAAWIIWDIHTQAVTEQVVIEQPVTFPYVPGLLSFRECPAVLAAFKKLRQRPDACIMDGHGRAHPRRLGYASHAGMWLGLPTIGCAKSRFCGEYKEPAARIGSTRQLMDKTEVIGRVVRTRAKVKPVFVSVGHLIMLDEAVQLVLSCCTGYRLPEPTRLADKLVAEYKRLR